MAFDSGLDLLRALCGALGIDLGARKITGITLTLDVDAVARVEVRELVEVRGDGKLKEFKRVLSRFTLNEIPSMSASPLSEEEQERIRKVCAYRDDLLQSWKESRRQTVNIPHLDAAVEAVRQALENGAKVMPEYLVASPELSPYVTLEPCTDAPHVVGGE